MDVSKIFCDGEGNFFFEFKEGRNLSVLLTDLWGSQYLFEILQTSLTFKNSEDGAKSGCENIDVPLNY